MHGAKAEPSSAHANVELGSLDEKLKVALVLVVVAGGAPLPIVVCGGVVSDGGWIVQLWLAGVASVFPAESVARTWKVWLPTASPL